MVGIKYRKPFRTLQPSTWARTYSKDFQPLSNQERNLT